MTSTKQDSGLRGKLADRGHCAHYLEDSLKGQLPRYDRTNTYDWNYEQAPEPIEFEIPHVPGNWQFCGLSVASPLGIPAGPLLNSRWLLYYAGLGFDVLVYKTVRSSHRECYALPNLLPIHCDGMLTGKEDSIPVANEMAGSWAVSFGMPSKSPAIWRTDVERARNLLARDKVLCVSVVGSMQPDWTIDDLAQDYARCADWAVQSGADAVEVNFSCPNVATCDGQLYLNFSAAQIVAARVRQAIGNVPLIVKIGHMTQADDVERFLDAVQDQVNGLAMTNSIAVRVNSSDGTALFDGNKRAICGNVTREAAVEQIRLFAQALKKRKRTLDLIGVGGVSSANDVEQFLNSGAQSVHIATAAMVNPATAIEIRQRLVHSDSATMSSMGDAK